MLALVGDLLNPLARWCMDIGQIAERTQRPEVLAYIANGSFDLAFLPRCGDMTSARDESVVAGESEKARIEPHQVALMFSDSRREIVEPKFAGTALKGFECMDVAADERLEVLAMRELQVHLAARAFHPAERVQLARSTVVQQSAEVPPVDIETFAGARLHANVSATAALFRTAWR